MSGKMLTVARYTKPPDVIKINESPAISLANKPIDVPIMAAKAVPNCARMASLLLNPLFTKIAKSPSSWGIS